MKDIKTNMIGAYGPWAASINGEKTPALSFRNPYFTDPVSWSDQARKKVLERLAQPHTGGRPKPIVQRKYEYDGLFIEELEWHLPYGPVTKAILLRPINAKGKLPGVLAFHDHGGNKYFGHRKITITDQPQHPLMIEHQKTYYSGLAWANELAKKGFAVLVPDTFPFESRRILFNDVAESIRENHNDLDPEKSENIEIYNQWAGKHENIIAKSLFCAGTTWPGVFLAEDQRALDVLEDRPEVDASRLGCCGLSGGGMRTVFMSGLDPRIKASVCVGFMTTWKDFLLYKAYMHTWMVYVPLLSNELDFPEILGLNTSAATLVLNDSDDDLYTLDEMKRADTILTEVFSKAGKSKNYQCTFHPGPHKFDQKMQEEAFDWFEKHI